MFYCKIWRYWKLTTPLKFICKYKSNWPNREYHKLSSWAKLSCFGHWIWSHTLLYSANAALNCGKLLFVKMVQNVSSSVPKNFSPAWYKAFASIAAMQWSTLQHLLRLPWNVWGIRCVSWKLWVNEYAYLNQNGQETLERSTGIASYCIFQFFSIPLLVNLFDVINFVIVASCEDFD